MLSYYITHEALRLVLRLFPDSGGCEREVGIIGRRVKNKKSFQQRKRKEKTVKAKKKKRKKYVETFITKKEKKKKKKNIK